MYQFLHAALSSCEPEFLYGMCTPRDFSGGMEDVASPQDPVLEQVYSSVSAAHNSCPEYSVELYYGPSSSFSFLQQIHRRLKELSPHQTIKDKHSRIDRGEEGLDRFKYRGLFFGQTRHGDKQRDDGIQNSDIIFLPIASATKIMAFSMLVNQIGRASCRERV